MTPRPEGAAPHEEPEPPKIHSGMTRDELNRLVEWNRTRCHQRGCQQRATRLYTRSQYNAHGGESEFRYQRCESHPVAGADWTPLIPAPVPAPAEAWNINPHVLRDALIFWLQQHPNERGSAYDVEVRRCLAILEEETR